MSSELEIERYDLVRSDQSCRGGGVACFVKNSISYNQKPNFCINTESIFIEIFLPKSKSVLIGILYRLSDKCDFVNCLEHTFSDTNVFEFQECYLLGDININLQSKDKEIFRCKPTNTINKDIKRYLILIPISFLPLVSKIIEKSNHFQIKDFLNKKKLISMYQSGFRMKHSTDLCLAQLIDFVATGVDKQMHTGMILVDLLKALNDPK